MSRRRKTVKRRGPQPITPFIEEAIASVNTMFAARGEPPPAPEAVQNYVLAFQWASDNPDAVGLLMQMTTTDIEGLVAGIAFADHFGHPDDEVHNAADMIRTWHILNGYAYFYDWWTRPIAEMSEQDIIDQIRKDRADNRLVLTDDGKPVDLG